MMTSPVPVPSTIRPSDEEYGILGKQLNGRYTILEKIGSGGQAKVFKAKDWSGNSVAVKFFDLHEISDWKDLELLKREIQAVKSLHIDGIPQYIDYFEEDHCAYLIEEYIPAKSLDYYLSHGVYFSEQVVERILKKCLRILNELHHQTTPIIHRDIKPGNILWDNQIDKIWIVDLGSITAFRSKQNGSTVAGTAGYMAPEQAVSMASQASDIYGLGMTIIHLLSGVSPSDMKVTGLKTQYQKYLPPHLSPKMQKLIANMVEPNPKRRLGSVDAVLDQLDSRSDKNNSPKSITDLNMNYYNIINKRVNHFDAQSNNYQPDSYDDKKKNNILINLVITGVLIISIIVLCCFNGMTSDTFKNGGYIGLIVSFLVALIATIALALRIRHR